MQKVPKLRKLLYSLVFIIFASSVYADEAKMKMGKDIFGGKGMCAGCHILKAAGAEGEIGPNLDGLKPTVCTSCRYCYWWPWCYASFW